MKTFKAIVRNEQRPFITGHNIFAKNEDDAIRIQKEYKIGNPLGGNAKFLRVHEAKDVRGTVWKEESLKRLRLQKR